MVMLSLCDGGSRTSSLCSSENSRAMRFNRATIVAREPADSMPFTATKYSSGRSKLDRTKSPCACCLKKRWIGPSGSHAKSRDTRSLIRFPGSNRMKPMRSSLTSNWMHSAWETS